jgi:hypothetical protein
MMRMIGFLKHLVDNHCHTDASKEGLVGFEAPAHVSHEIQA